MRVLLTIDRNLAFQQNLRGLSIGVLAMVVPSNRLIDIRPLMPRVLDALTKVRPGQVIRVGGHTSD